MIFTVFRYLILISIDFYYMYFIYSLALVSIEKIYQTLKAVFDHISKHLEVRQKYSAARRVFNPLLGVWKRGQTRSIVFGILLQSLLVTSTYSGALYKPDAGSSVATEWGSWSNSISSGMYLKSSTFPLSSNSVPSHSSYSTSAVAESK